MIETAEQAVDCDHVPSKIDNAEKSNRMLITGNA